MKPLQPFQKIFLFPQGSCYDQQHNPPFLSIDIGFHLLSCSEELQSKIKAGHRGCCCEMSVNWNVNVINYCEDLAEYFPAVKPCSPWLCLSSESCFLAYMRNKTTCFLLPRSSRRQCHISCSTLLLIRDIVPFQFEQGGTQPILTLEHKHYLFES